MKSFVTTLALVACFVLGADAQYRDPRFFHTRNFWDGFESGLHEAGKQMQRRVGQNLESAFHRISDLRDSVGSLSQKIENKVQQNLPEILFDPAETQSQNFDINNSPIEAIEGSIGDHYKGGLKVYLDSDAGPLLIPQESVNSYLDRVHSDDPVETFEVDPPTQNRRPLFDLTFGLGPIGKPDGYFPRFNFWTPNRFVPWYKGANVCINERVIDEPEPSTTTSNPVESGNREPLFGEPEAESGADAGIVVDADSTLQQSDLETERLIEEEKEIAGSSRDGRFFFGSFEISSCVDDLRNDRYVCTERVHYNGKTTTKETSHTCCPGYVKQHNECIPDEMKYIPESLESFGQTDFLTLAETADLVEMFNTTELTVFAPSNEAVQDFTIEYEESDLEDEFEITDNEVFRRKRSLPVDMRTIMKSHLYNGLLQENKMIDEQVLYSMAGNSTLRINIYEDSPVLKTVNCVPISTFNQFSKNGIIHTVDKVLEPVTQSVYDIITSQPRFSGIAKLLAGSELEERLKQPGQFTLFAPSDDAFEKLSDIQLSLIASGLPCNSAVVENHVLQNVICTAAIRNKVSKTINLLNNYLKLTQHTDGRLQVEDAHITERDIVATNGVIHVVDSLMWPFEAKPPMEVLANNNFTKFVQLLKAAGMAEEINNLENSNVFAPEDEAFGDIQGFLDKAKEDPEQLKEVLRFHITESPMEMNTLENNKIYDTRSGHPLRVNLNYGFDSFIFGRRRLSSVSAGCSPVQLNIARACGAKIHQLESVMTPARQTVLEHLESLPHYSIFAKLVKESSMAERYSGPGPLTIMAPTDYVFRTLPDSEYTSLMDDMELRDRIVQRHTLPDHICCNSVCHGNMWNRCSEVRDSLGSSIRLHKTQNGILRVEGARITECGMALKNGLVHKVDRLFEEPHVADHFSRRPIDRLWPDNTNKRHSVVHVFPGYN